MGWPFVTGTDGRCVCGGAQLWVAFYVYALGEEFVCILTLADLCLRTILDFCDVGGPHKHRKHQRLTAVVWHATPGTTHRRVLEQRKAKVNGRVRAAVLWGLHVSGFYYVPDAEYSDLLGSDGSLGHRGTKHRNSIFQLNWEMGLTVGS